MPNGYDLRSDQRDALEALERESGPFKSLVMPTGSGKTRVALYYAQNLIEQGRSVAYTTISNAHAEQVLREADLIDVNAEQIEGRNAVRSRGGDLDQRRLDIDDYNIGLHVGVFSYDSYFEGSGVPRAQNLIIDDAHAITAQDLTYSAVEINKGEWGRRFDDLVEIIKDSNPVISDQISGLQYPVHREGNAVLVPPPRNDETKQAIVESVSSLADGTGYQRFLLQQRLDSSPDFINWPCVVTSRSICWRPFILPFESLGRRPHGNLEEAELVLLTSTKDSEEFLQYRLGLTQSVREAEQDEESPEMGTRMVVPYPDLGTYAPPSEAQLNIIEQWVNRFDSVLVSVSSDDAKSRLEADLDNDISTLRYRSDQSIEDFESLPEPRVLILVNRPSGIDIRSSVCQVGIHLDLPYSVSGHESIAGEVESSGNVADASLAVRLSQLLGRLNRHPDDRSFHLILAGDLPIRRGSVFVRSLDPEALLDILIGRRGVRQDYGLPNEEELIDGAEGFLDGQDGFRSQYLDEIERIRGRYLQGSSNGFSPSPNEVIEANLYLSRGNFAEAARIFERIARSAESEGYNGEASFFDFQAICCVSVSDVDASEIFSRTAESVISRALQRNPPSNALVAALRQSQPSEDHESEEAKRQLAQLRLRKEALYAYERHIDDYEEALDGENLSDSDNWIDFWRDRLHVGDHDDLVDAYMEVFQLLGTDTPHREVEQNDAKIEWETSPGNRFRLALEVKGWDEGDRDEPSQLRVDDIIQARDNAESIDADAVLLASSKRGYERDVPTEASNREVSWFDEQTATSLADLISEQCATLNRVSSRATDINQVSHDALFLSSLLIENPGGEVEPSDIP